MDQNDVNACLDALERATRLADGVGLLRRIGELIGIPSNIYSRSGGKDSSTV